MGEIITSIKTYALTLDASAENGSAEIQTVYAFRIQNYVWFSSYYNYQAPNLGAYTDSVTITATSITPAQIFLSSVSILKITTNGTYLTTTEPAQTITIIIDSSQQIFAISFTGVITL
jgi:hypothetical protein